MKKTLGIFLIFIFCASASGQAIVTEESVKAAFLFHFINFSEWHDQQTEYYVCIPEDTELRGAAEEALKGKVVNNRKVTVVSRSNNCHVLVSEQIPTDDNAITVGSLAKGALLEFRVIDQKLRFAANLEQIKKSKVKISSQLLKLAILEEGQ